MYNRRSIKTAAVLAALLMLPGLCEARDNTAVFPTVTLDTRYDSNVRFTSKNENTTGDFIASINPGIELTSRGKHYDVRGFYNLTADYYADNKDLNNLSHGFGLNFDAELSKKWRFSVGDRADYSQDSLKAIGEGILLTRTDILSNTVYASLGRQMSTNTHLTLTASDRIQEFDDPQFVDSRTDIATLTATKQYSLIGTAHASYAYSVFKFDTEDSQIETHGINIGFREAVSSSMYLELSGGVDYANYPTTGTDLFFTGNASFEKTFKDSVMTLMYERALTTPTGLADEISLRDSLSFIWDFRVRNNVSASFFTALAKNRSEPSGSVSVNSVLVEVAGNWQPYKWLIFGAGLSQYQQWPEDTFDNGLKRNKVFINATLIGDVWRF